MPDLSTIGNDVLTHLQREVGTTEYWTEPDVHGIINFLYKTLARQYRNIKQYWPRQSQTILDILYLLPETFLAVDECLFDGEALDPISIYEIRLMDNEWRTRSGDPDYFCLDYKVGKLLLWYFPAREAEIAVVGPVIPIPLTATDIPEPPYSNGIILESGAVSFLLSQEGGGQNLERSSYWYDIFVDELTEFSKRKMPFMDDALRSIDEYRGPKRGPRYPSNYPTIRWGR